MKVLLISHTCQSRTEGLPRAECLSRLPGIDLRVLVPHRWLHYGRWRSPQRPIGRGFDWKVGRVAWPWAGPAQYYLHCYPQLPQILREFRPDVIDLWEEPWGLVSAHACLLRNRLLPTARIVSETEQNIDKALPFPFERLRAYTLKNADFAVARNHEAVNVLRAKGYRGAAEVVPNGVDAEMFRPLDRRAARANLGIGAHKANGRGLLVGYVGRLVEEKGLMDLVEAVALCPPAVRLVLVGSGPMRAKLHRRAQELKLGDRLTLIPERPLAELPQVMNALDVLVLPSHTTYRWKEQFGRVIIEAHACGIPVIGSDSGAIPHVVGDGGFIVPEHSPGALSSTMMRLCTDPLLRSRMGAIGRDRVTAHYTWQRVAQRMHAIYNRLLSPLAEARAQPHAIEKTESAPQRHGVTEEATPEEARNLICLSP